MDDYMLVKCELKLTDPEKVEAIEITSGADHDDYFHISGHCLHSRIHVSTPMYQLSPKEIFNLAAIMHLIEHRAKISLFFRGEKFKIETTQLATSFLFPEFPRRFESAYKSIIKQFQELSKHMPELRHIYKNEQYIWSREYLIASPPKNDWYYHLPYQVWEQSKEVRSHLQAFIAGKFNPNKRLLEPRLVKNILDFLTIRTSQ